VAAIHPASRLDSALDGRASFVRTQLRSADPKVRTAALRALPHAGLPDAATGCAEALPDLNPEVRVEALHCLAATEPTRHLSALVDRAYVEEYGPARIALLDAMGGVLDPQVATGAARLLKREAEAPKMTGGPGRPLAQLARSPAPWARDVLSEVACKEGALQAAAVRAFGGLSVPQCIAELCQDATESRPSGGEVATPASLRKACLSLEPVPH